MIEMALVNAESVIVRIVTTKIDPEAGLKPGFRWLPVEEVRPDAPEGSVIEGPTIAVLKDRVTRTWTARAKTAEEISAEKDTRVSSVDLLVVDVLLNFENRLRALEGKNAVTRTDFRAALKARL